MAKFTSADRQRIIDGYLSATGRNMFHPAEFIDWLEGQPDHEAHPWFFSKSDKEAAREYRVGLARQMASGLRITVKDTVHVSKPVAVKIREYPAMVSPVASRCSGGGYHRFDPTDAESVDELRRQAAAALRSWLARYAGLADQLSVDITAIEVTATRIDALDAA